MISHFLAFGFSQLMCQTRLTVDGNNLHKLPHIFELFKKTLDWDVTALQHYVISQETTRDNLL